MQQYKSEFQFLKFYSKSLNDRSRWVDILKILLLILFAGMQIFFQSCKKLVEIDPPINAITTAQVFSDDADATSAMNGIYYNMINSLSDPGFNRGGITIYSGLSSDEFNLFSTTVTDRFQFQQNNLVATNNIIYSSFWQQAYSYIYRANAVIEGLQNSTSVHDSVKTELIAEAKFVRAFENFYLYNLFGDIPLVTTINWRNTNLIARSSMNDVYSSIKADLKDAQTFLKSDYSIGYGQRIIPNSFAATALLARVDLYSNDWVNAEIEATKLINNTAMYKLAVSPLNVYSTTSTEAIWQIKHDSSVFTGYATYEGFNLIPKTGSAPFVYLTDSILKSFEPGDLRKTVWVDSVKYPNTVAGKYYKFPRKYRMGPNQQLTSPYSEFYTVLRLAEQYLIRAEARANQNRLTEAIADINVIRQRANLLPLPNTLTLPQVIAAIQQENRIEFFAEWGHRWLDLKRLGKANDILSNMKGNNWQSTDQLYPIPQTELRVNPSLSQNDGY